MVHTWPVYRTMTQLTNKDWTFFVQNERGDTCDGRLRGQIMCQAAADKAAELLGVDIPLTVFPLVGKRFELGGEEINP